MLEAVYIPGTLVHARGRELDGNGWFSWVAAEISRVRPVTGSEEDRTLIHVPLELRSGRVVFRRFRPIN
jgi:hypothetical protein